MAFAAASVLACCMMTRQCGSITAVGRVSHALSWVLLVAKFMFPVDLYSAAYCCGGFCTSHLGVVVRPSLERLRPLLCELYTGLARHCQSDILNEIFSRLPFLPVPSILS